MPDFGLMAAAIIAAVLAVSLLKWPWLFAAGLVAVMRLGAVNGQYIDAAVDEAVGWGMPDRLARRLRPRPGGGRGGRMSAG